ncbi:MAG: MFS transporter [Bacteroidetes bacterium]|nr:MFS transporter [Bacteroidota bacterium]
MAILGIVSVTPSLPYIAADLNVTADRIGLVVSLFALPGIFFTPVYGVLADKYGRKNVLVPSLFLFGVFGTAGFFVRDFNLLLLFRFVSGMGAASLGALNVALIGDLFPAETRGKVVGYNNSALNFGTTIVPIAGGMLAKIHWNYVFLLPLLAVALALFILFSFKEPVTAERKSVSYFREFVKAVKDFKILMIFLVNVLVYIIHFGSVWTYIPFIIEKKFLSSSVINGFVLAGLSLTASFVSIFFGRLTKNMSQARIFVYSFVLTSSALFAVTLINEWHLLFLPMIIYGAGFGMILPNIQTLVISLAPENQRGALVSINRTVSLLGQFLGPVISGFILYLSGTGISSIYTLFYFYSVVCIIALGVSQIPFISKKSTG